MLELESNNPVLKALIEGGYSLSEFVAFVKFLTDYIQAHPDAIPFNLPNLAVASNIPLDTIRDYFMVLGQTFTLFKQLKDPLQSLGYTEKLPAPSIRSRKKSSVSKTKKQNAIQTIKLEDLQHISDFACITKTKGIPASHVPPYFTDLQQRFPGFFENKADGWNVSDFGQKCADQLLAHKKLNTIPKEIKFNDFALQVITE